jgi:hypothetical protein
MEVGRAGRVGWQKVVFHFLAPVMYEIAIVLYCTCGLKKVQVLIIKKKAPTTNSR